MKASKAPPQERPARRIEIGRRTAAARPVTIVIADDHTIFREGLRRLLETERSFRVVGEAGDGAEAVRAVQQLRPEILLLDMAMPRVAGTSRLSQSLPRSSRSSRLLVKVRCRRIQ